MRGWHSPHAMLWGSGIRVIKTGKGPILLLLAAAGYGVSKILYHSEFAMPPAAIMQPLLAATAKLVDKGWEGQ